MRWTISSSLSILTAWPTPCSELFTLPRKQQTKPFLPDDRIFLRTGKTARVVYVSHISGIKAEENYTDVLVA